MDEIKLVLALFGYGFGLFFLSSGLIILKRFRRGEGARMIGEIHKQLWNRYTDISFVSKNKATKQTRSLLAYHVVTNLLVALGIFYLVTVFLFH